MNDKTWFLLLWLPFIAKLGVFGNYTDFTTETIDSTTTTTTATTTLTTTPAPDPFLELHRGDRLTIKECQKRFLATDRAKQFIGRGRSDLYLDIECLCRAQALYCMFIGVQMSDAHQAYKEQVKKENEAANIQLNHTDLEALFHFFYPDYARGARLRDLYDITGCLFRYAAQPYIIQSPNDFNLVLCMCDPQSSLCPYAGINISHYAPLEELAKYAGVDDDNTFKIVRKANFDKHFTFHMIMLVAYSLVFIWGVTGNLLVLITIFGYLPRDNVTNIFLANQTVSDLMVLIFALPVSISINVFDQFQGGEVLCRSVWTVYFLGVFVTIYSQTAMSLERYLVICHPMKAQYISTPSRARKISAVVWVIGAALSVFPVYVARLRSIGDNFYSRFCGFDFNLETQGVKMYRNWEFIAKQYYMIVVSFLVPVGIMTYCYGKASLALLSSVKDLKRMTGSNNSDDSGDQKQKDKKQKIEDTKTRVAVVKMLIAILVVFVATWVPQLVYETLSANWWIGDLEKYELTFEEEGTAVGEIVEEQRKTAGTLFLLSIVNSAINPIVYAFLSRSFRRGFIRCFGRLPCCKSMAEKYKAEMTSTVSKSRTTGVSTVSKGETSTM